jgi:hypothetical protein
VEVVVYHELVDVGVAWAHNLMIVAST